MVHALQSMGITKIGFASPYVPTINNMAIDFLEQVGVETVARSEVQETLDNYGQGEMSPDAVYALGLAADHKDAQAVVLSCTDMRSVETIETLESKLGKPVITSNQAMVFQAMQLAGLNDPTQGYGGLFERLGTAQETAHA